MRRKKLLTAAIATALVAAQVVMPVAAADGGTVHVDVTTKTAVLQVIVPTKLSVAVDPMEMGSSGTQIYSETFSIVNQSEVPVRVDITSKVTLKEDAGMKLLPKKSDVSGASAAAGQVWMGVAAQTSDGKFIEEAGKDIGDLTEASANVTTFTQKMTGEGEDIALADEGEAAQVFYLKAAGGVTGFKLLNTTEAVNKELTYTQYRKLEAKTIADQTALNQLLADNDVYVATAVAADGQSLDKVEKGGTHTWDSGEIYYITDGNVVDADTITGTHDLYVYGGRDTVDATDGKAAFRYIGALSTAQVAWSNEDITDVDIVYSIVGVKSSDYDAMKTKGDITYGLYAPVPTTITGVKITDASGTRTYSTAAALATQIKSYGIAFVVGEDEDDLSELTASEIVIDGKEYEFTTSEAAAANCDKKAYKLSGFTAASASKVEVHYGNDYVITYTLS